MKIVQINSFSNGSTGKIMMSIHEALQNEGVESYVIWGRGRKSENKYEMNMGNKIGIYFHVLYSRVTGKTGLASKLATKKMIKKLKKIKPDIIHLHNIHGYYININILFDFIKKNNIKVIWTLHDCWAFTGKCTHFENAKCEKWKQQCYNCPIIKEYPKSFIDKSKYNYEMKKQTFSHCDNLTIVTPSIWLYKLVQLSFLNNYNVTVINNGINLEIFKPLKSDFKNKYNLSDKKVILGVANVWDKGKGLDDFIKLSKVIDDETKIVLVGLNKKQLKKLPKNILGISRTENQIELVKIYNSSDLFFNPTKEDNYPTVNLEALACKTPVYTYNTGGSSECLNLDNGKVVTLNDMCNNYKEYLNKSYLFDMSQIDVKKMIKKYIELYNSIRR